MPSFTLDTNCIIALENDEPSAPAIRTLVDAHGRGNITVAVVAISASERQKDRRQLQNFVEFQRRLAALGLGHLEILPPIFYWDVGFLDWSFWADDEVMLKLEQNIHAVLFPASPFLWSDFCAVNCIDPASTSPNSSWRNRKCDVLAIWSHIHDGREVFVTNDGNFHRRRAALIELGAGRVERAERAAALL